MNTEAVLFHSLSTFLSPFARISFDAEVFGEFVNCYDFVNVDVDSIPLMFVVMKCKMRPQVYIKISCALLAPSIV